MALVFDIYPLPLSWAPLQMVTEEFCYLSIFYIMWIGKKSRIFLALTLKGLFCKIATLHNYEHNIF